MPEHTQIEAVTVNHGTPLFAELMLRSLLRSDRPPLSVTVMDNDSGDGEDMKALSAYARLNHIPIVQSGYSTKSQHVNTHGEILREFVLSHSDCTHYLFVDPDVYFMKEDTLRIMLKELDGAPSVFAVMPRCTWDGENDHSLPTGNAFTGEKCFMRYTMRWPSGPEGLEAECEAVVVERVHPFCALIKNSAPFRRTVEEIGLSNAWVFSQKHGRLWDTLGLMTSVMKTHGLGYVLSSAMVFHFFSVSYDARWMENKTARCRELLGELRKLDSEPGHPCDVATRAAHDD